MNFKNSVTFIVEHFFSSLTDYIQYIHFKKILLKQKVPQINELVLNFKVNFVLTLASCGHESRHSERAG